MREFFLTTRRIGFSHWKNEDLPLAHKLWSNNKVSKYISGSGVFGMHEIAQRLEVEQHQQEEDGISYWPIFLLETGVFIGCCGLRMYDANKNILEIGFHIDSDFWSQGLATEAAQATIHYAFNTLKVAALFAGHNPKNKVSNRLLLKLGFEYTHDEFYQPTRLMHPSYLLKRKQV